MHVRLSHVGLSGDIDFDEDSSAPEEEEPHLRFKVGFRVYCRWLRV